MEKGCSRRQEVPRSHLLFHDMCCIFLALQAEKAEGYINLTNFMIDRAIECKKKQ